MAILHVQLSGTAQAPDGSTVAVPAPDVLLQRGPVVQAAISLADAFAAALVAQGKPVPGPLSGWALIDTGASCTCIDEEAAKRLGLPAIDKMKICSASAESAEHDVYAAHIEILGAGIASDVLRAPGCPLNAQGLIALIGRDWLRQGTIFYNGISGEFTLSIG